MHKLWHWFGDVRCLVFGFGCHCYCSFHCIEQIVWMPIANGARRETRIVERMDQTSRYREDGERMHGEYLIALFVRKRHKLHKMLLPMESFVPSLSGALLSADSPSPLPVQFILFAYRSSLRSLKWIFIACETASVVGRFRFLPVPECSSIVAASCPHTHTHRSDSTDGRRNKLKAEILWMCKTIYLIQTWIRYSLSNRNVPSIRSQTDSDWAGRHERDPSRE